MNVLVTGAAGYVGNKLVHALAENGYGVHAFVRSMPPGQPFLHPAIKVFQGDICNRQHLSAAMRGCQQVYHTAGTVKLWQRNRDIYFEQNVGGTVNILQLAVEHEVKKLVYTSSCDVWSPIDNYSLTENDPRINSFDSDYALSKYIAEKTVMEYSYKGLYTVIVNPSRIYGPSRFRDGQGVNRFIKWLLNNRITPLPWRMDVKSNYAFIDDVIKGHLLAMKNGLGGERYILGGENISYKRFLEIFKKLSNRKKIYLPIPPVLLRAWGLTEIIRGKLQAHDPVITPGLVKRLQLNKMFDCSKAISQLGYSITPFEKGLQFTIDHFKK